MRQAAPAMGRLLSVATGRLLEVERVAGQMSFTTIAYVGECLQSRRPILPHFSASSRRAPITVVRHQ